MSATADFPTFEQFRQKYRRLLIREARASELDPAGLEGLFWLAYQDAKVTFQPGLSNPTTWIMRNIQWSIRKESEDLRWHHFFYTDKDGEEVEVEYSGEPLGEEQELDGWQIADLGVVKEEVLGLLQEDTAVVARRLGVSRRLVQMIVHEGTEHVRSGRIREAWAVFDRLVQRQAAFDFSLV